MFMDYCRSKQLRPKTMASYEQTLKLFSRWLKEKYDIENAEEVKEPHMDNKRVDALNQSRNIRLLALKEIFEEDTDAEHSITMKQLLNRLLDYGVTAERRTVYEDIHILQNLYNMDIEHRDGERTYKLKSRKFSMAEIKLIKVGSTNEK